MGANRLGEKITALGKAIGAPITSHLLRHFAATQLVGAGTDLRTSAGRLGNSAEIMMRTYAGFLPQRDLEAAKELERTVLGA